MATEKKKTASQPAEKKAELGINFNLSIKLEPCFADAVMHDEHSTPVEMLISRLNDTEAMDDFTDLELGTARVKMKDGKEHFMLKNGDDFTELDSDHDLEGALNAIKEMNLSFFLRLVANSLDPVNADEATERVFVLA